LLSLIANELLLNSLKHAFDGRAAGRIDAELRTIRDQVTLTIRDDGNGLCPPAIESEEQRGTGMDLVQAISHQLGGEFVINRVPAGGTIATISFPSRMSRQQARRSSVTLTNYIMSKNVF
jgi:two-component sensor histidine kinase